MSEVKERPILFSATMVRAILDGRKNQTRRVFKDADFFGCFTGDCHHTHKDDCENAQGNFIADNCPYGRPGDRLWVRESFGYTDSDQETIAYRATEPEAKVPRWKPSIHMFRSDSRINLIVTDVRVERLQDISDEDAIAEGCKVFEDRKPPDPPRSPPGRCFVFEGTDYDLAKLCHSSPVTAFNKLWDKINGPESWDENPYVWVITFERQLDGVVHDGYPTGEK